MDQNDKKNLLLAFGLITLILVGWNYFFPPTPPKPQEVATASTPAKSDSVVPTTPEIVPTEVPRDRQQVLGEGQRLKIATGTLKGSINVRGARLDDLTLTQYREEPQAASSLIHLLSPVGAKSAYYAEFSWISNQKGMPVPNQETLWQVKRGEVLSPESPLILTWDNGQGLLFEQEIHVDKDYLFKIVQRVTNQGTQTLSLYPYGLISRHETPKTADFFILHEGPLGYLNNKLVEYKYKDLKEKNLESLSAKGGWLGITDKYWLTALIPDQTQDIKASFRGQPIQGHDHYQVDFMGAGKDLAPGQSYEMTSHLFAGPKILDLLDGYEVKLGVKNFDLAVDFGWFYIITKPIFLILTSFHDWIGNFGIAILMLTLILKLAFFPLANKSYRSMARMKALQPKMQVIRERYADDKLKMNQEIMDLYKKEKINPMAGCLPMLIQIPVFFALYKVLFITIEMRQAPFFGWITDLSAPDPTSLFNLFGLIPWDITSYLPTYFHIGIWPLIMGGTMYLQQKLSPPPADPTQAKVFAFLPLLFTVMLAQFPAGLVIYWAWNNILTILQQSAIMYFEKRKETRG